MNVRILGSRWVSLALGVTLLGSAMSSGLQSSEAAAVSKSKAAVTSAKKTVYTSKVTNPLVPYRFSNGDKSVLIPQSLANLLAKEAIPVAAEYDLIRSIPLTVDGYPEAASVEAPKSATSLLSALQSSPNLAVHMELLRRGRTSLSKDEQNDLVVRLLKRYEASPEDAVQFFDYGYAQLVYLNNQTGLFFLRKANDRLKTPFTSLAYAMGQFEVDLTQEKSAPNEMTMRKLDVIYKLGDAVMADVKNHQAGFWPQYVHVIQKVAQVPAYQDFADTDFSLRYVPSGKKAPGGLGGGGVVKQPSSSGNTRLSNNTTNLSNKKDVYGMLAVQGDTPNSTPSTPTNNTMLPPLPNGSSNSSPFSSNNLSMSQAFPAIPGVGNGATLAMAATTQTSPNNQTVQVSAQPIGSRTIPNSNHQLVFYAVQGIPNQWQVKVLDSQGQEELQFLTSHLDIVEDLDNDAVYELVVRQYRKNPLDPVRVYRLSGNRYELDQKSYQQFQ